MELFGTAGVRGPVESVVTPALALEIGRAAGAPGETFAVARDGRETGSALAAAVTAGLESAGADVRRCGVLPTPALAFASRGRRGVMITASHNPPRDNGIKLFADGVEYDRAAERRVEERVEREDPPVSWDEWGTETSLDVLERYRTAVADFVRDLAGDRHEPLGGLRIVVDCGNGVGSLATPQVCRTLGADVVALDATVDGHFPARESKPTPESLRDTRAFVADSERVDVAIAHDGDADRLAVLDPDGEIVHEDTVLAAVAEHYVRRADSPDPVVVTTPNASARIDERVREAGGRVERVRLGALHEGIERVRETGDADTEVVFAAEPWKHVHPAFGGWIDGVVSAALVSLLVAQSGGVDALTAPIAERPYRKVAVDCDDDAKAAAMDLIESRLPDRLPDGAVDTDYGVRIELPDASWVLVRPSGTEPFVRIYAESDNVDELVTTAQDVVERAVADTS